ncbi:MAG: rRNA maturation RNase YbeY [Dehalococcoidia bacterium]|nr:rRNA maturation RNase YbeY [Dehalococcoidia bacterium]
MREAVNESVPPKFGSGVGQKSYLRIIEGPVDNYNIETFIQEEYEELVERDHLVRYAVAALQAEGVVGPLELGIAVVDDYQVRELNRQYRGLDEPTDVLSFGLDEINDAEDQTGDAFVAVPDGVLHLGEVIIAYPFSLREAISGGRYIDKHIAHLVVHGVLHILDYDHEEPEDEAVMRAREEAVLGWQVYYPVRE